MCGIIGFTGRLQVADILIGGLERLEYRGYDSAGIAVRQNDATKIIKTTGKVAELRKKRLKQMTSKEPAESDIQDGQLMAVLQTSTRILMLPEK